MTKLHIVLYHPREGIVLLAQLRVIGESFTKVQYYRKYIFLHAYNTVKLVTYRLKWRVTVQLAWWLAYALPAI
jgi:hypothetical protein